MAGSVNLANVALGFDASQITKGVDLSANEMRKLGAVIKSSESGIDKYANEMRLLDVAQQKGAITAERLAAAQDALAKKYGVETYAMIEARQAAEKLAASKLRQQESAKQAALNEQRYGEMLASAQREALERQKKIDAELALGISLRRQVATADERMAASARQYDQFLKQGIIDIQTYNRLLDQLKTKQVAVASTPISGSSAVSELKMMAAQYAGMAAAFAGVKKSLSLAATAESNRISLEVLTGSVAKASMLFEGFRELDRSSPLSRSDFSRASQTLIGYGFAAEGTLPKLRQLSEISIGNADKFQSLTLAFGQVTAAGRLMGQEVLQMVNAGFNPLQEISRTTGRSMIELKAAMEAGAISSRMVEDALASATSEGGRFYDMNERLKNSAAGQYAKMRSDVELLATEIGTKLLPAAKSLMDLLATGSGKDGSGGFFANVTEAFSTGLEGMVGLGQDVFTNMDRQGKDGQKVNALMERIQTEELTKQLTLEYKRIPTAQEKERIAANMAKRMAEERKELEAIAAKEKAAADLKKDFADAADKAEKKAAADKQKEIDDLSKKFEDAHNKRVKDAEALGKATMDPLKEYEAELARIEELRAQGAIGDDLAKQAGDKAGQKLIGQANALDKSNALSISQTIAPALKAGSVEAYKFMLGQKDKLYEAAQEQNKTSLDQLDIAKQQLTALQNQPLLNKKR